MIVALYSFTSESGKDTCADFIEQWAEHHLRTCSRAAFADEMKLVCARALGCEAPREDSIRLIDEIKLRGYVRGFRDDGSAVTHNSGRDFIIGLAEAIRVLDDTFWIRHAGNPSADIHVLTDLRFEPEARWVKANGGKIVMVTRPGTIHRNEDCLEFTMVDAVIQNDSDLSVLHQRVTDTMNALFPPIS